MEELYEVYQEAAVPMPNAAQDVAAVQKISIVQNILPPSTAEIESDADSLAEGTNEDFIAAFNNFMREAENIEREISELESAADDLAMETRGTLAPLERQQILACFRAWTLVHEGMVPDSEMDQYALRAGIKAHGNESIACSRLMRAVVLTGAIKGTSSSRRKRARASSIDYAICQGMTEEAFTAELEKPRKRGEHHGVEQLAAEGRKARQAGQSQRATEQVAEVFSDWDHGSGFRVSGDFSSVESGYCLIIINVPSESGITEVRGQVVNDDAVLHRILLKWIRSRDKSDNS